MTKKSNSTDSCIKNLNKVIDTLTQKDETINNWKTIQPGCDSPHNMKNHIDKLNRELNKWKTLMPNCHTTKLAAKEITKLKSELEEWRNAVPNCETPQKLTAKITMDKNKQSQQANTKKQNNFNIYIDKFIRNFKNPDLNIKIEEITLKKFNDARNNIITKISNPNTSDEKIGIIDRYKIIDFLIFEFENGIEDPDLSNEKLMEIKRRFG